MFEADGKSRVREPREPIINLSVLWMGLAAVALTLAGLALP